MGEERQVMNLLLAHRSGFLSKVEAANKLMPVCEDALPLDLTTLRACIGVIFLANL